ncbi:Nlp family transcriptional regulator [Denitratisoma sp. DHT3]|uniref:helix-turn-helix domain-containing protein n=1 Tax=Denitratisoma sp. DHT3 TaxID=1981880 RepID=UPI0011984F48|nr:helix-turn-helix transcriptional regulator [Denitratisoma sp. DHT3]QDX82360.1 Nlp family transcriptional regulator [Denitratisoma sp. DHT3]
MNKTPAKKASREDWHPADIKAALHKAGWTLKNLALAYGLKDSTSMSAALVRSLPANEKRIADALGLHPMEIWPSRYNEDGSLKPRGIRALQCNAPSRPVNGNLILTI